MLTKIRRSLVLKTAILFAAAALVPFVLASAFLFRSARAALYGEIVSGLDARVGLMRDTLDARLAALRGNVLAWASFDVMNDLLADDIDKRVTVVLEGLKRDYGLDGDMYALTADLRVVAASDPAAIGRRLPAGSLAGALAGQATSTDLHTSALDGLPVVAFAVPIRARAVENRTIGVLLLEYHVRDLSATVLAGAVPLAAVLRPDGTVVSASSGWAPELEHVPDGWRELGRFIVAKARQRGAYDFAGFGWTVVGAAERAQALAPITRVERFSLAAGLGGIALLVALVAAAAARSIRPLAAVASTADRIATTMDLSHKVPAAGEDEVGRVARAFNRMVDEVNVHIDRLLEANIEMLEVLGSAIAKRDSDTSAHNYRVTLIALRLAEARGLPRPALQALVKGSFLHDVGKIGISDTMKTHVRHGTDILGRYAWLRDAMDIVGYHHEKFDGTGYLSGLAGEAIPLNARIFAIADVFDALTSARPYKVALSLDAALLTMRPDRRRHFDPELFDLFADMAPSLYAEICVAPPEALTDALQQRMRSYFFTNAAGPITAPIPPAVL
jgi:HAMP domain-containing protein